jgi:hypothetical protein
MEMMMSAFRNSETDWKRLYEVMYDMIQCFFVVTKYTTLYYFSAAIWGWTLIWNKGKVSKVCSRRTDLRPPCWYFSPGCRYEVGIFVLRTCHLFSRFCSSLRHSLLRVTSPSTTISFLICLHQAICN